MRLEQRLSALAEHNRLLVLELEDRRNQQNVGVFTYKMCVFT
jgi:hypothetical protein